MGPVHLLERSDLAVGSPRASKGPVKHDGLVQIEVAAWNRPLGHRGFQDNHVSALCRDIGNPVSIVYKARW